MAPNGACRLTDPNDMTGMKGLITVDSEAACLAACNKDLECMGVEFKNNEDCEIWHNRPIQVKVMADHACYRRAPCLEDNMDYAGNDLSDVANVDSAEQCQTLCQAELRCTHFTYVSTDRHGNADQNSKCHLKESDAGRKPQAGAVSGTRECGESPRVCQCWLA